jgi:hypothetical protein
MSGNSNTDPSDRSVPAGVLLRQEPDDEDDGDEEGDGDQDDEEEDGYSE